MPVAAHPRGAPHEQPRRVELRLHARQRERHGLVLDDLAPELLALLGVVEGVLVGRAADPQGLRRDGRARGLERLHRRLRLAALALAHAREALVEFLLAAEHVAGRHAAVVEEHVCGVRGAQTVL